VVRSTHIVEVVEYITSAEMLRFVLICNL